MEKSLKKMKASCNIVNRIKETNIKSGEILLVNCKSNCFRFRSPSIKHHDKATLYDKIIKINPSKLRINHHMLAYVTNAKDVCSPTKDKISVK